MNEESDLARAGLVKSKILKNNDNTFMVVVEEAGLF